MKTGFKVCDAMTERPFSIPQTATVEHCAKQMDANHIGGILVKDNGKLLGILTEQDIVRRVIAKGLQPNKTPVAEVMEKQMVTIAPDQDVYDALILMRDLNIRHLPVMDKGHMLGLLTLKDVLKIQPQLFELLVDRFEIREADRKPVFQYRKSEGICELCGEYDEEVKEVDGSVVCRKCRKEAKGSKK